MLPTPQASRAYSAGSTSLLDGRSPVAGATLPADAPGRLLPTPAAPRRYMCRCGQPLSFTASACPSCHCRLGYDAAQGELLPLEPAGMGGWWRTVGSSRHTPPLRRCANLNTAAGCNWLVEGAEPHSGNPPLCRSCRLTRVLPDLAGDEGDENALGWSRFEVTKRRLLASLIALRLPLRSKVHEDPAHGVAFDLVGGRQARAPASPGYADGVITFDIEDADEGRRVQRRLMLHEPSRTLLAQLRHDIGRHYWHQLIEVSPWLDAWRDLFGDERANFARAVQTHQEAGPPSNWRERFVSAYASSHPWEDWAETWCHYLSMVDAVATARGFGFDGTRGDLHFPRPLNNGADTTADSRSDDFVTLLSRWSELTRLLNEVSRSMGHPDSQPVVLPAAVVRKLKFVHRVVTGSAGPETMSASRVSQ